MRLDSSLLKPRACFVEGEGPVEALVRQRHPTEALACTQGAAMYFPVRQQHRWRPGSAAGLLTSASSSPAEIAYASNLFFACPQQLRIDPVRTRACPAALAALRRARRGGNDWTASILPMTTMI